MAPGTDPQVIKNSFGPFCASSNEFVFLGAGERSAFRRSSSGERERKRKKRKEKKKYSDFVPHYFRNEYIRPKFDLLPDFLNNGLARSQHTDWIDDTSTRLVLGELGPESAGLKDSRMRLFFSSFSFFSLQALVHFYN